MDPPMRVRYRPGVHLSRMRFRGVSGALPLHRAAGKVEETGLMILRARLSRNVIINPPEFVILFINPVKKPADEKKPPNATQRGCRLPWVQRSDLPPPGLGAHRLVRSAASRIARTSTKRDTPAR